mmetsp:Transcript_34731/g.82299  ORF Transcript_34731/g.82299 Transcript_34731/m.82299 type:complete len:301 (+) Transcript_34731:38-940(+)
MHLRSDLVGVVLGVVEVVLGRAEHRHHRVEDTELASGEHADHHAARAEALGAQLEVASLGGDAAEARGGAPLATRALLVDLGQEGVGRVRDDGRDHSRDNTGGERHSDVATRGALLGGGLHGRVDLLGPITLHGELGHGVGHLLAEDGTEARVEARHHALLLGDERHGRRRRRSERGVRHELDAGRLERAEEDVSDELGHRRGREVDGQAVVPRALLTQSLDELDLEELNTAELEPALDEVADNGRAKTSGKRAHTLGGDDLAETADHTLVVHVRHELHASLDDVHGAHGAVSDAAADTA